MHASMWTATAAGLMMLAGCADETPSGPVEEAPGVPLVNAAGQIIGDVRAGDSDGGLVLRVSARDLPPGEHAMHIHDIGICETPGFDSAGPHWNPTNASHGFRDERGPHAGDLRNIAVGQDGTLTAEVTVAGAFLSTSGRDVGEGAHQVLDASGAALVIHAGPDDYATDPSGASGDRIACAVLGEPAPGAVVNPDGNTAGNVSANTADGSATEASAGQNAFANLAENSVTVNSDLSPSNAQ